MGENMQYIGILCLALRINPLTLHPTYKPLFTFFCLDAKEGKYQVPILPTSTRLVVKQNNRLRNSLPIECH